MKKFTELSKYYVLSQDTQNLHCYKIACVKTRTWKAGRPINIARHVAFPAIKIAYVNPGIVKLALLSKLLKPERGKLALVSKLC